VQLFYSGNRISGYDYNQLVYPYNYRYAGTPWFTFSGYQELTVPFDTFWHWTVLPNLVTSKLTFSYYEKTFAIYNSSSFLVRFYDLYADSILNQNMSYVNRFSPGGDIVVGYWFNLNMGMPDSAYVQFFTYNTSNELTRDSIFIHSSSGWRMVAKSYYTYDASHNLVQVDCFEDSTTPLREKLKYQNTYDASGRLLTVLTNEFDGTNLTQYQKDTFTYNGSSTYFSSHVMHRWDGVNHYWAPINNTSRTFNSFNYPDSVLVQGFDSLANAWIPQDLYLLSYDSLYNPDTLSDFVYNGITFPSSASFITKYYYEQAPGAGVANILPATNNAIVYPNPVKEILFLSQLRIDKNAAVYISLTTLKGQLIRTMSTSWQNTPIQIPVNDLPPGIYFATVQDALGTVIHQQAIIKE
jgi:hypothetical protein